MTTDSGDIRFDPLNAFCFTVEIQGVIEAGKAFFKSVSGLKGETEATGYPEGGLNVTTRQIMGTTKWPNLVLKRGFARFGGFPLVNWRQEFLAPAKLGGTPLKRRNGRVIQLSSDLKEVCWWHFLAGWPCKWEGPDYDATKSELAIETIEIAHEGLVFETGGSAG
jgi:phage tail-like protein